MDDDKQVDDAALARLEGLKVEYITSYMVLKVASTDRLFSEFAGKALVSAAEYIAALEAALARVRAELARRDEQPY